MAEHSLMQKKANRRVESRKRSSGSLPVAFVSAAFARVASVRLGVALFSCFRSSNRAGAYRQSGPRTLVIAGGIPPTRYSPGGRGRLPAPRLPQNEACRFPALRSPEGASQQGDSLQLRVREIQLWSH